MMIQNEFHREKYILTWIDTEALYPRFAMLNMLKKLKELAEAKKMFVEAVFFDFEGTDSKKECARYARYVDLISQVNINGGCLETIKEFFLEKINDNPPELIVFPYCSKGIHFASTIACELGRGVINGCVGVKLREGDFVFLKTLYGEKVMLQVLPLEKPFIVTFKPFAGNLERKTFFKEKACVEEKNVKFLSRKLKNRIKLVKKEKLSQKDRPVDTEVTFYGGTGLKTKENFKLLKLTAEKLGISISVTKDAVRKGLASEENVAGVGRRKIFSALTVLFGVKCTYENLGCIKSNVLIGVSENDQDPVFNFVHAKIIADPSEVLKHILKELE